MSDDQSMPGDAPGRPSSPTLRSMLPGHVPAGAAICRTRVSVTPGRGIDGSPEITPVEAPDIATLYERLARMRIANEGVRDRRGRPCAFSVEPIEIVVGPIAFGPDTLEATATWRDHVTSTHYLERLRKALASGRAEQARRDREARAVKERSQLTRLGMKLLGRDLAPEIPPAPSQPWTGAGDPWNMTLTRHLIRYYDAGERDGDALVRAATAAFAKHPEKVADMVSRHADDLQPPDNVMGDLMRAALAARPGAGDLDGIVARHADAGTQASRVCREYLARNEEERFQTMVAGPTAALRALADALDMEDAGRAGRAPDDRP